MTQATKTIEGVTYGLLKSAMAPGCYALMMRWPDGLVHISGPLLTDEGFWISHAEDLYEDEAALVDVAARTRSDVLARLDP